MSPIERQILVESGLFEMIRWARAVYYLKGEAQQVVARELYRQLAERLPAASPEHLERLGGYVVAMGVELA